MRFRRKRNEEVVTHEDPPRRHSFMLSGVEANGTMVFICRNCVADIRIDRETLRRVLVDKSDVLTSLPAVVCVNEFPDGLIRVLPERPNMYDAGADREARKAGYHIHA